MLGFQDTFFAESAALMQRDRTQLQIKRQLTASNTVEKKLSHSRLRPLNGILLRLSVEQDVQLGNFDNPAPINFAADTRGGMG